MLPTFEFLAYRLAQVAGACVWSIPCESISQRLYPGFYDFFWGVKVWLSSCQTNDLWMAKHMPQVWELI